MIQTLKVCEKHNRPCFWVHKDGHCSWQNTGCFTIIDKCGTCENIELINGKKYCTIFAFPKGMWVYTDCFRATHLVKAEAEKTKATNPLKASKKAKKGH